MGNGKVVMLCPNNEMAPEYAEQEEDGGGEIVVNVCEGDFVLQFPTWLATAAARASRPLALSEPLVLEYWAGRAFWKLPMSRAP